MCNLNTLTIYRRTKQLLTSKTVTIVATISITESKIFNWTFFPKLERWQILSFKRNIFTFPVWNFRYWLLIARDLLKQGWHKGLQWFFNTFYLKWFQLVKILKCFKKSIAFLKVNDFTCPVIFWADLVNFKLTQLLEKCIFYLNEKILLEYSKK